MGNRVLDIKEFLITVQEDEKGQSVSFSHFRTGYGLNLPVPSHLPAGTPDWSAWVHSKFNRLVEPLVRACIEEEEKVARQQAS